MKTDELTYLFERDLLRLRSEVLHYASDEALWAIAPGTSNSGGNLVLHMCGNLRHFIGHILGSSGYVRDRDLEFSATGISRDDLVKEIDTTLTEILPVLKSLTAKVLDAEFPKEISGSRHSTGLALLHLFGHLSYHLGQLNYHRRITGFNY